MTSKLSTLLFMLVISTNLQACESGDQAGCVYEKHNMRFSFTERWHIEEESGWFSEPYVFLETEDSGLIMVMLQPKEDDKTLSVFATEYSASANSQMIMGAFKSAGFTDITSKTKHKGLQELMTLDIFDEKLPMTRQYFEFHSAKKTAYIILQIDNEELDDIDGLEKVLATFEFIEKSAK